MRERRRKEAEGFQESSGHKKTLEQGKNRKKWKIFGENEWNERYLWMCCILFRVVNGLCVRTSFYPDEYWQSVEVSHAMAFGRGHKTWEWRKGAEIRSYVHPLLFSSLYTALRWIRADSWYAIAYGPRVLQAVFASLTDVYVFKLSRRIFGSRTAKWTLCCHILCWYCYSYYTATVTATATATATVTDSATATATATAIATATANATATATVRFSFYCHIRTFSNSIESTFVIISLFYWPWKSLPPLLPSADFLLHLYSLLCSQTLYQTEGKRERDRKREKQKEKEKEHMYMSRPLALVFAALAFLFRPTSIVIFLPLGLVHLFSLSTARRKCKLIIRELLPISLSLLLFLLLIDRYYYGHWVCAPFNFFYHNVYMGISSYFGVYHPLWYMYEGFPVLLGTFLPFALFGVVHSRCNFLLLPILSTTVALSLNTHKEYRFLLSLLPLCCIYSAYSLSLCEDAHALRLMRFRHSKHCEGTATDTDTDTDTGIAIATATATLTAPATHTASHSHCCCY